MSHILKNIFIVLFLVSGISASNSLETLNDSKEVKQSITSLRGFLNLLNQNIEKEDEPVREFVLAAQSLDQIEQELVIKTTRSFFHDKLKKDFLNLCEAVYEVESLEANHIRLVLRHIAELNLRLKENVRRGVSLQYADPLVEGIQDFNEAVVDLLTNQDFNVGGIGNTLKDWFVDRPVEFISENKKYVFVGSSLVLTAIAGAVWYKLRNKDEAQEKKKEISSSSIGARKAKKSSSSFTQTDISSEVTLADVEEMGQEVLKEYGFAVKSEDEIRKNIIGNLTNLKEVTTELQKAKHYQKNGIEGAKNALLKDFLEKLNLVKISEEHFVQIESDKLLARAIKQAEENVRVLDVVYRKEVLKRAEKVPMPVQK